MKSPASLTCVLAVLASSLLLAPALHAQPTPQGDGLYRIEGTVVSVNRDTSTLTLRQRSHGSMTWTVHYDDATSFSYRNTATSLEEVKNGRRVICLGRYEERDGKKELTAVIVDVRSGK